MSNKKQRDSAVADAELRARKRGSNKENQEDKEAPDILGAQEEEDVIF